MQTPIDLSQYNDILTLSKNSRSFYDITDWIGGKLKKYNNYHLLTQQFSSSLNSGNDYANKEFSVVIILGKPKQNKQTKEL